MQPKRLNDDDRASLKPFADAVLRIHKQLRSLSIQELELLQTACSNASQTNCGWDTYEAAELIRRDVAVQLTLKQRRVGQEANRD